MQTKIIQKAQRYAEVDSAGRPVAFYSDAAGHDIPPGAIPIPDAAWQAHFNDQPQAWDAKAKAWVPYKPSAAEMLAQAQVAKLAELRAAYQAGLEAGVTYQGANFDSDEHSQTEIARVLVALANGWALPAGFVWVDAANTQHAVPNVAWLQGLADAMATHKAGLFARLQKAKAAVRAAKTVAAVNKVVL